MANPSYFNGSDYAAGVHYITHSVKVNSQNIPNNTSNITVTLTLTEVGNYGSWTTDGRPWNIKVGGVEKASGTRSYDFRSGSRTITLGSWTGNVSHNADGTLTIAVSGYYSSYSFGSATTSENHTLTTIPRTSVPTLNKSSMNAGETVTITTNRASSAFTHTVRWRYGSSGDWTNIATSVGASTTWTPSAATIGAKIPNATSGTFQINVITYSGSTQLGDKTVSMTIGLASTVVPTVPVHTITEATTGLAAKFGVYVQGKSRLKVVSIASGASGSTIKSYSTTIAGVTYSGGTITSNIISSSGTVAVKTTVTDSRGRTATKTTTISVSAYSPPKILRFSAWRANSAGNALDDGTFARVSQRFTITSLNNKNNKSWKVEYRQVGTSTWVQLDSGSVYDYDSAFNSTSAILSTESSYEFRLTITDYFGSVATRTTVGTAFTLLDFNASGKGLAVGKVSEKNALEVAIPAEFGDTVTVNGSPVITEANNSLLKLSLNFANGATLITAQELEVENPLLYGWFMQPIYKSGAVILYGVVQPAYNRLVLYLRATGGAIPADGNYEVFLMRVDLA